MLRENSASLCIMATGLIAYGNGLAAAAKLDHERSCHPSEQVPPLDRNRHCIESVLLVALAINVRHDVWLPGVAANLSPPHGLAPSASKLCIVGAYVTLVIFLL